MGSNKPSKLSILAKRLLDPKTRKLIKAGFLTTELDYTRKGIRALRALQHDQYADQLVGLAEQELEEQSEEAENEAD